MGNRLKTYLILAIAIAFMVFSFGPVVADQSKVPLIGGGQAYKMLDDFVLESESPTVAGDSWYVDSGKSASGDGKSWDYAVVTVDEAINLCTANNGDVIHVAPGHAESYTAANGFDLDVAGITIIMYGVGQDIPEFTFADTDADIAIGAANCAIYGGRYLAGIDAVVRGFSVEAAGDDVILSGLYFPEPTTSTFEFVRTILVATGADNLIVKNSIYYNCDAVGATNFIDLDTGVVNGLQLINNYIYGEFAEGPIHTDKVCLEMLIKDNTIVNMTSGEHGIEIAADATGLMVNNLVSTDAIGTSYDVGHLNEHGNYWDDYNVYDTMAVPWTTNETGVDRWGASELAQIEKEANDALVDEGLDHLLKVAAGTSAAYPSDVTDLSILGYIMAIEGDVTDFDEATDSLEALGDQVADTNQQSNIVAANLTDMLDHIAKTIDGGTHAYPDSPVNESIVAYVLSKSAEAAVSSYDNQTDSLEAIRDNQDTGVLLGAGINLDHLLLLDGTEVYPEQCITDSILAKILADDAAANPNTYNNTTDSLEALGIKTEQIAGADGIALFPSAALPANDVSIAEVLREAYDQQEKAVSGSTAVMVNGDTLFTIAGGPIEIVSLISVCVADATATTASTLQYSHNPTAGAATTFSNASASLETVDGGASVVLQGTTLATAPVLNTSGAGINASGGISIILQPGIVTAVIGVGTTTSTWIHYLRYKPLARGVTVTGT